MLDSSALAAFTLQQVGLPAAEIGIGRAQVGQALIMAASADWCLCVAGRVSRTSISAGTRTGGAKDFWLIFTLLGVTMSQKSSVIQIANLVSRVLTPDMRVNFAIACFRNHRIRWRLCGRGRRECGVRFVSQRSVSAEVTAEPWISRKRRLRHYRDAA